MLNKSEKKNNIILIGFMATGKTFVARYLNKMTGLPYVDMDALIEEKAGMPVAEIFKYKGEVYFRDLESEICSSLLNLNQTVIATGGGIVERSKNIENLRKAGSVFLLCSSVKNIYDRVKNKKHRPLLNVKDPEAEITRLLKKREAVYKQAADCWLDSDRYSIKEISEQIWSIYKQKNLV
ncbi:MAG: shikimate kinase [bacterium]|nr:shikimate kinase [bacterium]